jgi:hypothetical protein
MNLLTIQMLVKNNEKTIDFTLESLRPLIDLNAQIVIGDLSCTDSTIKKCEAYNTQIVRLSLNNDRSKARNHLLDSFKSKWYLFIEPYETILTGIDSIISIITSTSRNAYKFNVLQGDVLSKQIRLWHKETNLKFKNPVFETLEGQAEDTEIYVACGKNDPSLNLELAKNWQKQSPISIEPLYYIGFAYLAQNNWSTFLNYADMYLHQEKRDSMSAIMTRYYYAMVKCYIEKDYQSALQHLLYCLMSKPLMAEFWCLLGDVYYEIKQYDKAQYFYENAIILGSRRLKSDDWPLEISKYKEYPQKKIDNCIEIKQSSKIYYGKGS